MGWSIGHDSRFGKFGRDIGYGVPAFCDHPGCGKHIDRGLSYICGGEPYGHDRGCGLYFCEEHLMMNSKGIQLCERCYPRVKKPFIPTPDMPEWSKHKMTDESWAEWREENPEAVKDLERKLGIDT